MRFPMTKSGFEALKKEHAQLKNVERLKNIADIEEALGHGDLKENAEYHAAKERQGFIAARLADLESKISGAQVIDPATLSGSKVIFGATVELLDQDTEAQVVYQIVGVEEADAAKGKISINSPIARALIGKEEGDELEVRTPRGARSMEIDSIEFK